MTRRKFSREFKIEAVKLVTERGVAVVQACRDLGLAESVLRHWMRELAATPTTAFLGNGLDLPRFRSGVLFMLSGDFFQRPRVIFHPVLNGACANCRSR